MPHLELGRPVDQLAIIELLYDSIESPGGFLLALEAIRTVSGSKTIHTMIVNAQAHVAEGFFAGEVDDAQFVDYEANWHHRDPRVPATRNRFGRALSDIEIIDPSDFEKSALYNEMLKPADLRYSITANTRVSEALLVAHSMMRPRKAGPFEREETEAFQRLMRHLDRALRLKALVEGMRKEVADLRRALDFVPGGAARSRRTWSGGGHECGGRATACHGRRAQTRAGSTCGDDGPRNAEAHGGDCGNGGVCRGANALEGHAFDPHPSVIRRPRRAKAPWRRVSAAEAGECSA